MPTSPSQPHGGVNSLKFALDFVDGKGALAIKPQRLWNLVAVEKLELEVPDLRYPADTGGGPLRFQTRRCRLRGARLAATEREIEQWLASRRLSAYGLGDVRVRIANGEARLAFTARVGGHRAPATARLALAATPSPESQRARLVIRDLRLYGFLPAPAPLVGLALLRALTDRAERQGAPVLPTVRGVSELVFNPLGLVLWNALPPQGWRLPAYRRARLRELVFDDGRVTLEYEDTDEPSPELAPDPMGTAMTACPEGELLLAKNQLEAALAAYEAAAAFPGEGHEVSPLVLERRMWILAASPDRWDDAIELARKMLDRGAGPPVATTARLVLAMIAAERGLYDAAALRYSALADEAEAEGDAEDAAVAGVRAAELYLLNSDPENRELATRWLERVVSKAQRFDRPAAEMLAQRYAAETRWDDLIALERLRISEEDEPTAQARAQLRLAKLWLETLGDVPRALEELERSAGNDPDNPEAWALLARAHHALGDRERALRAIDEFVELVRDDPPRAAEAELQAAQWLQEGATDLSPALGRVRAGLEICPGHANALAAEVRLLAAAGTSAEAHAALDRALAAMAAGTLGDRAQEELGEAAWILRRWDAARAAWEPLHRAGFEPRVERALRLGSIAQRQGDGRAAIEFYTVALDASATGTDRARAYDAIARLYEHTGDVNSAVESWITGAQDARTDEDSVARAQRWAFAAGLRRRQGRTDEALGLYENALALDPRHLAALDALEQLARQRGNSEEVVRTLERKVQAMQGRPHEQKAILTRLAEYAADKLGRPSMARDAYRRALALDPTHRPALQWLARDAHARGEPAPDELLAPDAAGGATVGARGRSVTQRLRAIKSDIIEDANDKAVDRSALAAQLRVRAGTCSDPDEAARRYLEASALAEKLGDESQAIADLEAALVHSPEHLVALEALADLSYRRRDLARARALYLRLVDKPVTLTPAELYRRLGELAEAEEDFEQAAEHFRRAVVTDPTLVPAHEALARLAQHRDDPAAVYASLKAILTLLPLDSVDEITDIRQRLGDVALRLGDLKSARHYYELVLAQDRDRQGALAPLADVYAAAGDWEACATTLGQLSRLVGDARRRAELLYRQAEVHRLHLNRADLADAGYLKASDLDAAHQPTLRRLVVHYLTHGDSASLVEVVDELETMGAPLGEVTVEAGIGVALTGDDERAARYLQGAEAAALAHALSTLRVDDPTVVDAALGAAIRALARGLLGDTATAERLAQQRLGKSLDRRLSIDPTERGARVARARLAERLGEVQRARAHYSVVAFLEPDGAIARHLATLPPPASLAGPPAEAEVSQSHPLRESLRALGPLTLGLGAPTEGAPIAPRHAALDEVARALGFSELSVSAFDALGEPAWAEPSSPPHLRVRSSIVDDEPALRFAAARAFHLLRAGVSLVQGRSHEDNAALLWATHAILEPARAPAEPAPAVAAWVTRLRALPLRPALLSSTERSGLVDALEAVMSDFDLGEHLDEHLESERQVADRIAFAVTGDLAAALRALMPPDVAPEDRARRLADTPSLRALVEFATAYAS